MGWSAIAARRHVDLSRVGLGVSDELRDCLGRNRWMHRYDVRLPANACDRRDVADEIETKLVIERGIDGVPTAHDEEGITVRGRTHGCLGSNIAGRTRPVFNDEWLAEPLGEPLAYQPCKDVTRAGGRKRHDHAHRLRRVRLRPRDARDGRERGSTCSQMQEFAAWKFHGATSWNASHSLTRRQVIPTDSAAMP